MKINDDFIKESLSGECVLVPVGDKYENGIFTLNETAEKIYDLLCGGKSRDEIVAVLSGEYSTERAQIERFTDSFIAKLLKAGILTDD